MKLKRIYENPEPNDGMRILVDRLWPRGVSKDQAKLDIWLKEIAPSTELRKLFNHKPSEFSTFTQKYRAELMEHPEKITAQNQLLDLMKREEVTLLYGAKDPIHNHANILKEFLEEKMD